MNSKILDDCEKYLPDRVLELICSFHHRKCKDCDKLLENEHFNKHYDYTVAKKNKEIFTKNKLEFNIKHSFQCFDCFKNPKYKGKTEAKGYYCYGFAFNYKTEKELQEC